MGFTIFIQCPTAKQRPTNKHRLKEQPGEPHAIGVKPEGRRPGQVLRDVARKNGDEEGRDQ